MKTAVNFLIQITWGLPQSFLGFLLFLGNLRREHGLYRGEIVTQWPYDHSVSLGLFLFVTEEKRVGRKWYQQLLQHEYGHSIQSLILGWLYLPVIGLPSFIWCNLPVFEAYRNKKEVSYYSFYPERWANRLSEKVTGLKTM